MGVQLRSLTGAFKSNTNLTKVVIPDSVITIGSTAFLGCSSLKSITIGKGVTSIGYEAFYTCKAVTELKYNATECADFNSSTEAFAYFGTNGIGVTLTIGANVKKLPAYMFDYIDAPSKAKLVTVVFEEGSVCESIGKAAFMSMTTLKTMELPVSVTTIGASAFSSCANVSFSIESTVTSIGANAFYSSGLTSISLSDSITEIESEMFYSCKKLTNVNIPNTIVSIGKSAFYECTNLTKVVIPDSVITIGSTAFLGCSSLKSITIGKGVTSIGYEAFYTCKAVTELKYNATECADFNSSTEAFAYFGTNGIGVTLTIGANVKKLPAYMFDYIDAPSKAKLVTVVFEEGSVCESIGKAAFMNMTTIKNVYYGCTAGNWATITVGANNTGLTNATIYYYSVTEPALNTDGTAYDGNYWRYVDGVPKPW